MNLIVPHVLTHSITSVTVFLFWFITQLCSFPQKMYNIKHFFLLFDAAFTMYNSSYLKYHLLILNNCCNFVSQTSLIYLSVGISACLFVCLNVSLSICQFFDPTNSLALWGIGLHINILIASLLPFHNNSIIIMNGPLVFI